MRRSLVTESFPTGYASRTITTPSPSFGARLGTSFPSRESVIPAAQVLVEITMGSDGRRLVVCQRRQDVLQEPHRRGGGDGLGTTRDRRRRPDADPQSRAGKVAWTAPEPGTPVLAGAGVLLVKTRAGALALHDLKTGAIRWTAAPPAEGSDWTGLIHGNRVIVRDRSTDDCLSSRPCTKLGVYDLASGAVHRMPPGKYVGSGDGWVATVVHRGGSTAGNYDYRAYSTTWGRMSRNPEPGGLTRDRWHF